MKMDYVLAKVNSNQVSLKKINEESTIPFLCPICSKRLKDSSPVLDGDTLDLPKVYSKRVNAELNIGNCEYCNSTITSINAFILDRDITSDEVDTDYFMTKYLDGVVKKYKQKYIYAIAIDDNFLGKVTIYKEGILDRDSIYGSNKDFKRNVAILSLGCMEDSQISTCYGVSNGYNKPKWYTAAEILIKLIDNIEI